MGVKAPLSQSPVTYCDLCWHIFEDGEHIYDDEDGHDVCETCWHTTNNHEICDECGEWIEKDAVYDMEDNMVFCNEDCYQAHYSAWLSQLANL